MYTAPPPPYAEKGGNNYSVQPQVSLIQQPMNIGAPIFIAGYYPMQCICPACQQSIVTRTETQSGLLTWLIFGFLILVGCWLGCCLIPFCVDECKDILHFCPNCTQLIGVKKRL